MLILCMKMHIYASVESLLRVVAMKIVECSREKPWGIHPSLRHNHCPRCGWAAPAAPALQAALPAAWTVIDGGLEAAA
jgi:hypothetical protein